MTEQQIFPAPMVDPETKEFWDATREGVFLVRYCRTCDSAHYYPRTICPHCGSDDTYFEQASGKGVIYSYSVMRRAKVPYAIAYVTLEGTDISMMTNIVDCDLDNLEIGQAVQLKFSKTVDDGSQLPTFTPL
ncbi:DNA-binding protein [Alphaproteobacteria bacterium 46_93_T64]|nr:DNA-binding protein [Alphaproteobacteria bacterium 46_93_T64]